MKNLSNEQLNDVSGGPIPVVVWYAVSAIAGAIGGYAAGSHTTQTTNVTINSCPAPQ